jgi:hypothetical protein
MMSAREQATPMQRAAPLLRLVRDSVPAADVPETLFDSLLAKAVKFEMLATELLRHATDEPDEGRVPLEALAIDSRQLADVIRRILKA